MPAPKTKEIAVSIQSQTFPRLMFFNRFSHDRIGPMWILYFGFADEADYLRDSYACGVDETTIERQKDDLLQFAGLTGTPAPEDIVPWRPKASAITRVDVANIILAARTGRIG